MKAVQLLQFGGPESLQTLELPMPVPAPGQALIQVRAAGVNLADALMRQNRYAFAPPLPVVPGMEAVGVVSALGADVGADVAVQTPAVGTRVAVPLFAAGSYFGAYAEYLVCDASLLVPIPDSVSDEIATALLVQGLTALYLTRQASPQGKTVLITAAAGGVGSLLIQLAKRAGARRVIAAASSADKLALARDLGADATVNYSHADWSEQLLAASDGGGPDLVYESVGGTITPTCLAALAEGGRLLIYGALNIQQFQLGVPELMRLIFRNQWLGGFALTPLLDPPGLRAALTELFALAASGALRAQIGGRYALDQAGAAQAALESRATVGKLVLLP